MNIQKEVSCVAGADLSRTKKGGILVGKQTKVEKRDLTPQNKVQAALVRGHVLTHRKCGLRHSGNSGNPRKLEKTGVDLTR